MGACRARLARLVGVQAAITLDLTQNITIWMLDIVHDFMLIALIEESFHLTLT
jgi:hypothetical protein